jgi:hypothetical protein
LRAASGVTGAMNLALGLRAGAFLAICRIVWVIELVSVL